MGVLERGPGGCVSRPSRRGCASGRLTLTVASVRRRLCRQEELEGSLVSSVAGAGLTCTAVLQLSVVPALSLAVVRTGVKKRTIESPTNRATNRVHVSRVPLED